jgi:hypothetical protein
MIFSKRFILLAIAFFCITMQFSSQVYGGEETSIDPLEKIYVVPSQLHIIPEGIFFLNSQGNLDKACGVFSDAGGIYVMKGLYQCPACGKWNRDGICHNTLCPLLLK